MNRKPLVQVAKDERQPLREAMHDVQQSVAAYYIATATGDDLGRHVRTFLVNAQTLNDLFANAVADSKSYAAVLASPNRADSKLILGVKYARNIAQHVLHIVRPSDKMHLIGGQLGLRVYAFWDEIPAQAHAKLRPSTQKLKPDYDAALCGHEVTGRMLALLRFYAEIAPTIVHRDHRGEWTGFPLMSQPGVASPLHPDEPSDLADAWTWLNSRLPNGDSRVVCGQLTLNGTSYVFGHTFVGRHSFAPFVESVQQANRDINAGFQYLIGDVSRNIEDATEQFPLALQGAVFVSPEEVTSWASPLAKVEQSDDWCGYAHFDVWRQLVKLERGGLTSEAVEYGLRRARRLNALMPPSM